MAIDPRHAELINRVRQRETDNIADLNALYALLDVPTVTTVLPGQSIQSVLDRGEIVQLVAGNYQETVVIRGAGKRIRGAALGGSVIIGQAAPAIAVEPGASDFVANSFDAAVVNYSEAVIRLGLNTAAQVSVDAEPHGISLASVRVPYHRGKRAFEINCRDWILDNCFSGDVRHASFDTQGVCIINSSGIGRIIGGEFSAGSNPFLCGGDWMKLRRDGVIVHPSDIRSVGVRYTRPLDWMGVIGNRVKNLYEVKNGIDVTADDCYFSGNWDDAQTGEAVLFTPTRDGIVVGARFTNNTIDNVPSFMTITGRHYNVYTPTRTDVYVSGNRVRMDHRRFNGTGRALSMGNSPNQLFWAGNRIYGGGDTLMEFYRGSYMDENGASVAGQPIEMFAWTDNVHETGKYGFRVDNQPGAGSAGQGLVLMPNRAVVRNTFGCRPKLPPETGLDIINYQRNNFPVTDNNHYVALATMLEQYPWEEAS